MHFSMRRFVGLMASLLLTTAGIAVTAVPAHAADGTITGTISAANRTVGAGTLRIQRHDGSTWVTHNTTFIGRNAPKTFSVAAPPGTYRMSFESSDYRTLPSYYGDDVWSSPQLGKPGTFTVPDGGTVARNIAYPHLSRITGTFTSDGEPAANGSVEIIRLGPDQSTDFWGWDQSVAADGRYLIPSAPDGTYAVALRRVNPDTGSYENKVVGGFNDFPTDLNAPGLFKVAGADQVRNYDWSGTSPAPTPLTAPSIPAKARVGSPLAVNLGTWTETPVFTYQWNRDGKAIPGATGTTYTPTPADVKKRLTVTIGATQALNHPGTATTNAVVVGKAAPRITAAKKVKRHKLKLRINAAGAVPSGKVKVLLGKRVVGKGKVKRGKATIRLGGAVKRGKARLKIVYAGNKAVASATTKVKVKVVS
jgi:hypothetical protein